MQKYLLHHPLHHHLSQVSSNLMLDPNHQNHVQYLPLNVPIESIVLPPDLPIHQTYALTANNDMLFQFSYTTGYHSLGPYYRITGIVRTVLIFVRAPDDKN